MSCLVKTSRVTHADVDLTRPCLIAAAHSKPLNPLGHSPHKITSLLNILIVYLQTEELTIWPSGQFTV